MRFVRTTLVCLAGALLASGASLAAAGQQQNPPPAVPSAAAQRVPGLEPTGPVMTISVDDAVTMALKNNLGLQIERLNPQIEDENIASARSPYTPNLQSRFSFGGSKIIPTDFTEGNTAYTNDSLSTQFTFQQQALPWTNASVSAQFNGSRSTSGRFGASFNPSLSSSFNISANQPLWRNFVTNPVKNQIQQAVIGRQIADLTLRQRVVATEGNVRRQYWQLVGAIERLKVARQNLEISEGQLRNNKVRVEVGTMAPIDIVASQAEVAANQEAVITAEANIRAQEDALRALILDPASPEFWTARIEPANQPQLQEVQIDLEGALKTALEARTDIVIARRNLQVSDLGLKLAKNQTLPDVSLSASLTGTGSGGTQFEFTNNDPRQGVENEVTRSFGSSLGDVFGFVYPNWSVAVNFAYPLGKAAAEANHARARIQRRQQDANLKLLELQIVQQVRTAARNVVSSYQRVQSTRVARELAEQRLNAQQKRFDVGLSTLFELTQAQRDVVVQRNAELNAVIAYNQALVDFQLVQVAPSSGF